MVSLRIPGAKHNRNPLQSKGRPPRRSRGRRGGSQSRGDGPECANDQEVESESGWSTGISLGFGSGAETAAKQISANPRQVQNP